MFSFASKKIKKIKKFHAIYVKNKGVVKKGGVPD
jgi:hypothetical protein